jgi:hypothetical protein
MNNESTPPVNNQALRPPLRVLLGEARISTRRISAPQRSIA